MGPDVPGSGSVYTGSAGGTGQRTGIPRGRPPAGRTGGGDAPGVGSKLLATWRYTGFNADKACQSILKQTDSHHYSFKATSVGKRPCPHRPEGRKTSGLSTRRPMPKPITTHKMQLPR